MHGSGSIPLHVFGFLLEQLFSSGSSLFQLSSPLILPGVHLYVFLLFCSDFSQTNHDVILGHNLTSVSDATFDLRLYSVAYFLSFVGSMYFWTGVRLILSSLQTFDVTSPSFILYPLFLFKR